VVPWPGMDSISDNKEERRFIACHEAAPAVVYCTCKRLPPLYQVSILPRNQSLGSNMLLPKEEAHIQSKELLLEQFYSCACSSFFMIADTVLISNSGPPTIWWACWRAF